MIEIKSITLSVNKNLKPVPDYSVYYFYDTERQSYVRSKVNRLRLETLDRARAHQVLAKLQVLYESNKALLGLLEKAVTDEQEAIDYYASILAFEGPNTPTVTPYIDYIRKQEQHHKAMLQVLIDRVKADIV